MSHKAENDAIIRDINDVKIGEATILCACGEEIQVHEKWEMEDIVCPTCGCVYQISLDEVNLELVKDPKEE